MIFAFRSKKKFLKFAKSNQRKHLNFAFCNHNLSIIFAMTEYSLCILQYEYLRICNALKYAYKKIIIIFHSTY